MPVPEYRVLLANSISLRKQIMLINQLFYSMNGLAAVKPFKSSCCSGLTQNLSRLETLGQLVEKATVNHISCIWIIGKALATATNVNKYLQSGLHFSLPPFLVLYTSFVPYQLSSYSFKMSYCIFLLCI